MNPQTLRYSESFVRRSVRRYWWRQVGPLFLVGLGALGAFLVYRLAAGDRTWLVGAAGVILVLGCAVVTASYVIHLSRSLERLRRMKAPEATLELGPVRFRVTSGAGSSEIEWSIIKQIWRFDDVWILFFSASEFMLLPVADLSAEALAFIEERAVHHKAILS